MFTLNSDHQLTIKRIESMNELFNTINHYTEVYGVENVHQIAIQVAAQMCPEDKKLEMVQTLIQELQRLTENGE